MTDTHECLKAISEKWEGPFEQRITCNRETGDRGVSDWVVRVYKKTKSGGISKQGGGVLILNYCPICGERLIADSPAPPA